MTTSYVQRIWPLAVTLVQAACGGATAKVVRRVDLQDRQPVVQAAAETPLALEPPAFGLATIECLGDRDELDKCLAHAAARLGGTHYLVLVRDSFSYDYYVPGQVLTTYVQQPAPTPLLQPTLPPVGASGIAPPIVPPPPQTISVPQTTYLPGYMAYKTVHSAMAGVYRWTRPAAGGHEDQPTSPQLQQAFGCAVRCMKRSHKPSWLMCWSQCEHVSDGRAHSAPQNERARSGAANPWELDPKLLRWFDACAELSDEASGSWPNLCNFRWTGGSP